MYHFIKALLLPPASLIVLAAVGILLAAVGRRRTGLWLAALAIGGLHVLGSPAVATRLLAAVQSADDGSPAAVAEAQAIVILGGDMDHHAPEYGGATVGPLTLERLRLGAVRHRETGLPVLVSGGASRGLPESPLAVAMERTLAQDLATPVAWVEAGSADTAENARMSALMLHPLGVRRILLVTHAWHMPRAAEAFTRAGFTVIPAGTGHAAPAPLHLVALLPTAHGLEQSYFAIHELIGRLYYRWSHADGFVTPSPP
ncbi:MAG: YdcF family protein [Alphaproteobacteria bacterium]